MKLLNLIIFVFVVSSSGTVTSLEVIAKKDVLTPLGKSEIKKFLSLLEDSKNQAIVGISNHNINYKEIPEEGSAIFQKGEESYMLYWDDFNNDGEKEYLVIFLMSGSGHFSGVQGVYSLKEKILTSLEFNNRVIKNLFPGKDMSRFHSYIAHPFAVRKNGSTFLRFVSDVKKGTVLTYIWKGTKFSKSNSN